MKGSGLPNHYQVLGLPHTATFAEIKAKYLSLAKALHPDRTHGDLDKEEHLKLVIAANYVLSDEDRRREYDGRWEAVYGAGRFNLLRRVQTTRIRPTSTRRTPVRSSLFRSIGYDPFEHLLEIEFRTGAIFQYFDVPEQVHAEFMSTDKKGTYYRTHILGAFRERCRK